mgnify:CR=1 FL=1
MSHYRLTLTLGTDPVKVLYEVHKATARLEYGWGRKMHASKAVSVHIRECWAKDEKCKLYQAWLAQRDAHEDDVEAERLRGEDAASP